MRDSTPPWRTGRLSLAFLLVPPLAWLVVAYLGSLAVLLVSAFLTTNSFTGAVVYTVTGDNIVRVLTEDLFRTVTAHGRDGASRDGPLHRHGGAAGSLYGQDRFAADAAGARRRRDDPAAARV